MGTQDFVGAASVCNPGSKYARKKGPSSRVGSADSVEVGHSRSSDACNTKYYLEAVWVITTLNDLPGCTQQATAFVA